MNARHALTVTLLLAHLAHAQVPATCDDPRAIDKYQLLRRLSLDLRGRIPSYEEFTALDTQATVPDATVAAWLASDDFRVVARRYHEDLFWPNVGNAAVSSVSTQLVSVGTPAALAISSVAKRKLYRAAPDINTATLGQQCGDFEQTHFLGTTFVPDPAFVRTSVVGTVTVKQEGWRMVAPYWAPTTPVKVCAYDAMETTSVTVASKVIGCNTPEADARPECGCGPGLRYCYGPTAQSRDLMLAAMREQLLRQVDRVSTGGRPYTELLTSRTIEVNGPLAFWKRNLATHYNVGRLYVDLDPNEPVPNLDFGDATTWQTVDRGSDLHAGVLTAPGYLLRFQTNRGRGNRFRIDFECESFVPPSQLETPAAGCSDTGTDMTKRCTCRYCHRMLEPLAAHWGQFSEAGSTLMTDPVDFPKVKASCVGSTSALCRRFYVTEGDNAGSLLAFQYADAQHQDIADSLAGGPKKRVNEIVASGTLAKCTVKRAWQFLLKREMRVSGTELDELPTLDTLATGFKTNAYSLPWLFHQIVKHPSYRSVR